MVSQNDFHFAFQNKDKFLSVMDRGLGGFNGGWFQSHNEWLHVAVFLLKPQRLIGITILHSFF